PADHPIAKVSAAISALRSYSVTDSDFPVRPFASIRATFSKARIQLEEAKASESSDSCAQALENLDYLVRAQAFWLFCFGLEHDFKTDSLVE
ncbi:MAG: hypothetical protein QMC36_06200, partial [Patescibacteria group bacterium]